MLHIYIEMCWLIVVATINIFQVNMVDLWMNEVILWVSVVILQSYVQIVATKLTYHKCEANTNLEQILSWMNDPPMVPSV